jgi:hypothetical protein
MLGLMTLHLNERDDVRTYARLIREHLASNGGAPRFRRARLNDPRGSSSLRRDRLARRANP